MHNGHRAGTTFNMDMPAPTGASSHWRQQPYEDLGSLPEKDTILREEDIEETTVPWKLELNIHNTECVCAYVPLDSQRLQTGLLLPGRMRCIT
jgi:hypothetical protein